MGFAGHPAKFLMSNREHRFRDTRHGLWEMIHDVLVVCPRCGACANITTHPPGQREWFAPRRLTCLHCGLVRHWAKHVISAGGHEARDGFFGEPLWLQTPCENNIFWAYNLEHLTLLERYVAASLREQRKDAQWGWINKGMFNRLPKWIIAAKNRAAVLKAIDRLKLRYLETG
jgi:hypothetical protein